MKTYRAWFKRWDGKLITMPGAPAFPNRFNALRHCRFDVAWNGPTHPKGAEAHQQYVTNDDNFQIEEISNIPAAVIIRSFGNTGVPSWWPEDAKHAVRVWAWLLPLNGSFSAEYLATRITETYDVENPKTNADVISLKSVSL